MGIRIFPSRGSSPGRGLAAAPGFEVVVPEADQDRYALLLFELRRIPRPDSKITAEIEALVLNRCVLGAVEVLNEAGADVDVAGTTNRPVVEARFGGPDAPPRAAIAAHAVLVTVRRVQRAAENEFQVVGALTVGMATRRPDGVLVESGGADILIQRLRERAAPGQILLSDEAVAACQAVVETVPARAGVGAPGAEPIGAHVLRDVR